ASRKVRERSRGAQRNPHEGNPRRRKPKLLNVEEQKRVRGATEGEDAERDEVLARVSRKRMRRASGRRPRAVLAGLRGWLVHAQNKRRERKDAGNDGERENRP